MKKLIKISVILIIFSFALVIYALENPSQPPPYSYLNFQSQSKWLIFPRLTKFIDNLIFNNSKLGFNLNSPTALFHLKSTSSTTIPFQIESLNPNYFNPNLFPGWSYRRAITIDNTQNTSTLTDYQVLVNLDTQTLISQNKMRSDCGDIRFTDSDGSTQLNYWLESGCNSPSTTIWVKVPSIPSSSLKTIYLYYGNNNASSQSNPNNMGFIFFDDFEDGIIDSNKWRIIGSSTLVTEINGYLRTYSEGNGWQAVRSLVNFNGNYQILMKASIQGYLNYYGNIFLGFIDSSSTDPTDTLEDSNNSPIRIGITEREVTGRPIVGLQTNGANRTRGDLIGNGAGGIFNYDLIKINWLNTYSYFYAQSQEFVASTTLTLYSPANKTFDLLLGGLDRGTYSDPTVVKVFWIIVRNNFFLQNELPITLSSEESVFQYVSSLYLSTSSNLGLLTSNPLSTLSVNGNVSIGYATSAPDYGLIVLGKVGIGTTTPLTSLEIANRNDVILAGGRYGINIETLTSDKTLNPRVDKIYQYLNPNNSDRIIYLSTTTAQIGDKFIIKNTAPYTSSYRLQINVGSLTIDYIYANSIREYVFDVGGWRLSFLVWETSYTYSLGYNARVYDKAFPIGYNADAYSSGLAIGYNADAENSGLAIGYNTNATSSGTAIGYNVQAFNGGTAVGYESRGYNYGVSVGYYSGYNLSSSTVNRNVLIGAYSGYQLTTGIGNIILGYQSGYDTTTSPTTGSYNILIGYQAGTPANDTSNFLNIGNLIFATGTNTATGSNISNGKVGIRTLSPTALLHLKGQTGYDQLRLETPYTPTSTADPNGNIGDITWDDNYLYIKTNVGWKRKALSTF